MLPFCSRFIVLTASLSSRPFAMWLCSPSHWEMSLFLHRFESELNSWLALARMWQKPWCELCKFWVLAHFLSHTMWTKEVSLLDVKPLGGEPRCPSLHPGLASSHLSPKSTRGPRGDQKAPYMTLSWPQTCEWAQLRPEVSPSRPVVSGAIMFIVSSHWDCSVCYTAGANWYPSVLKLFLMGLGSVT